ncbi:eukaryotic translation initiation factor 5B isoform X2 [Agrilus planipennis]|uniref:Eukaryotic translation initiation factor 5B n=1 Tax=Agrilus planipennis TaxID=224129 RepID=A0A1W4XTU6_AGRPL|nr:eukaryotic translation initiation factor 5B isoform X2 [Agrilus planipennis]
MGKAKKGYKGGKTEDSDSTGEGATEELIEKIPNKKTKSAQKSKVAESINEEELPSKNKKHSKSKKEKKIESSDSDAEDVPVTKIQKSFAVLDIDDDDDSEPELPNQNESDSDTKPVKKNTKKKSNKTSDESRTIESQSAGKKSKKSRRKREDSDEDIDKVLAELELEYSGVKKEPAGEDDATENQSKNKDKVRTEEKEKSDGKDNVEQEETSIVKTAAQKKKEKKEKQKKAASKKVEEGTEKTETANVQSEIKIEKEIEAENKQEGEENVEEEKDSKKKKKKGAKVEEEKKDAKKGPSKKAIAAMQEALKKLKEEEEKLKKEEEERILREEEAEKARQEAIRLEKEKKERKKQKEKERKERLKAEGKLLTAKQKADRARAQAMIESLKAQGLELPDVGERKVRPGTRIKPSKMQKQKAEEQKENKVPPESGVKEKEKKEEPKIAQEEAEKSQEPEEIEDVKDAWDADSTDDEVSEETSSKDTTTTEIKSEKQEQQTTTKKDDSEAEESENSGDEDDENDSESSDEEEDEDGDHKTDAEKRREKAEARIEQRKIDAEKNQTVDNLRAAVVCVLGHVDTGKTKILDKLRRTNVQDGEAGGITQQIGATNVPMDAIKEQIKIVKGYNEMSFKLPGLLIIDTPGHESFSNLRNRGSSLCDIAILVVDIMHGLEPQTIESINLLKSKKTPFVVALNKIDRLYDWQTMSRKDVREIIKAQAQNTQREFEQRTKEVIIQFAEQGLNAALFYENPDSRSYVSMVPTSAVTGEGMGNLLSMIVDFCQNMLAKRLMYSDDLQATVLEVKAISGLGTTIDAILVNGMLREGETMVLAGTDGPIVTQIRSLLMPQPLRELRVKNAYVEYREIKAAQGVKIAAKELEKAIAGLNLYIAHKPDEVEIFKEIVAKELKSALSGIKLQERGVYVQASTLGSLEALLEFLKCSKIPYSGIRIGPVVKKDVMKASIMLEHDSQYATILAFDVKVERDAQELADNLGVKIFQADIIYHLFDKFMAYREELKQRKREEFKNIAVFPCKLKILPQFVFNSRDPIVCGVMVEAGIVKEGTPICVPSKEFVDLGIVTSIEVNHKPVESARKGMEVCIKIDPIPGESPKMFGRHFDETDFLVSKISRQSIDACKDYFRDDLLKTDWQLMVELKKLFQIL